jgi:hypothetical protein
MLPVAFMKIGYTHEVAPNIINRPIKLIQQVRLTTFIDNSIINIAGMTMAETTFGDPSLLFNVICGNHGVWY